MSKIFMIKTLNNISEKGLDLLTDNFVINNDFESPEGIIVRSADMHDMDLSRSLKFIGRAGAGVNNIPLERCSELGIVVSNAPGGNANAVKELVLTAMLLSSRKIMEGIKWVEENRNDPNLSKTVEEAKKQFIGPELKGKSLGVVGLGAVGVEVANMGVDLGMSVYGYDPYITISHAWGLNSHVIRTESLEQLFQACDFVSVHVPLTDSTKNMVNANHLKGAKKGLVLMNLARNGLIEQDSLVNAISDGTIRKFITDFPGDDSICLDNTICIPHLGASTPESEDNSAIMVVNQMMDYLNNGNILNSVNYPDCDMGRPTAKHRITVNHRNIPNMIGQITAVLAKHNINIANLLNRHKGNWAYTMVDVDSSLTYELRDEMRAIEGVVRVRLVR